MQVERRTVLDELALIIVGATLLILVTSLWAYLWVPSSPGF